MSALVVPIAAIDVGEIARIVLLFVVSGLLSVLLLVCVRFLIFKFCRIPKEGVHLSVDGGEKTKKKRFFWVNLCFTLLFFSFIISVMPIHDYFCETDYDSTSNDLVGVWRFDRYYGDRRFNEEDFKNFELVLFKDQTFRLSGVPRWMIDYSHEKVDDSPRRRINELTDKKAKIWILSTPEHENDGVIEGRWQIVEDFGGDPRWVDLISRGYDFDPWEMTVNGLFAPGFPYEHGARKGVALYKDKGGETSAAFRQ